jgi:hypothetical protein
MLLKEKTEVPDEKRTPVHLVHQNTTLTSQHAWMRKEKHKGLIENLKANDHLEGLDVNGKIILK